MKKFLPLLIVLVMILSACSPATQAPATTNKQTTSNAQATAPAATSATAATQPAEPTKAAAAAAPKTLTMGVGQESYPMRGWTVDTDDAFSMAYMGVLETLVKIDFDGKMVPNLAESWSMVDDLTWQFNLRKDVTFQNGEPFNAAAVVKALTYVRSSPTPPRGLSPKTFDSVEAKDDYTIIIKTAKKDALMPNRLTSPNTGILAPAAYTAANGPVNAFGTGTGPFILTKEVKEQSLSLVKNPKYWGGEVKLDEVKVLYIPDSQVRAGMLKTGEIDIDIHVPVEQVPVLEAETSVTVYKVENPRTTTLHLNMSRPPFNDVRVRQAVAYALDKEAIVVATLENAGSPAVGPIAPSEVWVNPNLTGYPYSPDKAKALLAEAGIQPGKLTVGLWTYPTRANLPPTAVAIQNMLSKVGINVEIRIAQYDPMEPDVLAGKFDMFIISRSHVTDNYDPEGFFTSDYSCKGSFNMSHFCDPKFDELLAQAGTLTDPNARYDIYRQLQDVIDKQAAGVFLNYTMYINGVNNRVVNFKTHPLERIVITKDLDVK